MTEARLANPDGTAIDHWYIVRGWQWKVNTARVRKRCKRCGVVLRNNRHRCRKKKPARLT